jgi:hypothetical protein
MVPIDVLVDWLVISIRGSFESCKQQTAHDMRRHAAVSAWRFWAAATSRVAYTQCAESFVEKVWNGYDSAYRTTGHGAMPMSAIECLEIGRNPVGWMRRQVGHEPRIRNLLQWTGRRPGASEAMLRWASPPCA